MFTHSEYFCDGILENQMAFVFQKLILKQNIISDQYIR